MRGVVSAMTDLAETIGDRIKMVRGTLSQADFALRLKVSKNTVGNYERGDRSPDADFLAHLYEEFGADITWLLTGQGTMLISGQKAPNSPPAEVAIETVDVELNARISEAVGRAYKSCGIHLTDLDRGRAIADIYNDIRAAAPESWEEKLVAVRMAENQLRRRLLTPITSQDGTNAAKHAG